MLTFRSIAFRIKTFAVLIAAIFTIVNTVAQPLNTDLYKNLSIRNLGPGTMSGRITSIDALQSNPQIIVVGAASGGVWKSENGGITWQSMFDSMSTINIGSVALQQNNPSVIWAGTGEGNPRNSMNLGNGIYKSIDGGRTWKRMGLEKTYAIHRIIIDPLHPNIVYAGVIGNPFIDHAERGVFKTTDGGETWSKVLYTNQQSGVGDMTMDPTNPNKLFVNMWQHKRTTYDFKSGGSGSGLFMTLDGGKNWTKLGKAQGLPDTVGRIGITISASSPNRIYAMVEAPKNGLYKSDDGGFRWELINTEASVVTNRPFYFQDIYTDPKNENRIFSLYQTVSMSEDAGKTFKELPTMSNIHADHHALWISSKDPSFMINGNDGGLAISHDGGNKWWFIETLPLGQFYHVNVDNETPYNVYGGLQDNGSWTGPAYLWRRGGIRNTYWQTVLGGDGFDVIPDPEDSRYGYAMSQGGALARYDKQSGYTMGIRPPAPDLKTRTRFNWNAAFSLDPLNAKTIYYGSQFVHKSIDKGMTWQIISPDLTLNIPEQQKQEESGGLTIDVTAAENHNTILSLAVSPLQAGVIWAGTDDGNVQLTQDGGKSWTNVTSRISGLPKESWIQQIRTTKYNAGDAWVVANNYRQGDFAPYIFRTKDFGKNWERIVDANKMQGYALSFIQDPVQPKLLFAGTENGLWVSIDEGKTWKQWQNGYPSVSTYDLAIQERESDLVIASFGRGMWVLDDIRPLRKAAQENIGAKSLMLYDIGSAVQVQGSLAAPGTGDAGDATFEAQNRRFGIARIPVYVKPKSTSKDTTTSGRARRDSLVTNIYNDKDVLIRTLTTTRIDTGLNYINWALDEKGIRMPAAAGIGRGGGFRQNEEGAASEPGGLAAVPGTYKVVVKYAGIKDSGMIQVLADPRTPKSPEVLQAQKTAIERLNKSIEKLTTATTRLKESSDLADKLSNQLANVSGKDADSLRKATKAIQDSLKNLNELVFGKGLTKQGYGRPYSLTALTKLSEARSAITSKPVAPGMQDLEVINQAEQLTAEFIARVNNFYANTWAQYRMKVENTKMPLFKDYQPIK